MKEVINIYCDESCHLLSDDSNIMALGAVWCKASKTQEVFERIKEIKRKHNLKSFFIKPGEKHPRAYEIKWNKISSAKLPFFKDLIDFFFDNDDLHFRVLVVPDKNSLDHEKYNQTHDGFYYKMYFDMLKVILNPEFTHNIYLDIKDTRSKEKVVQLKDVLRNNHYDYSKQIIKKIQQVRSHEVELIQLTDLLIGAVSYVNRDLKSSKAKNELIDRIRYKSKYSLTKSTLVKETKFNVFIWKSLN